MGHNSQHLKILHRPNATKSIAPSQRFRHKSDDANSLFNKHDYINMTVITVTRVIMLNCGYDINILELHVGMNTCQNVIIPRI